MDAQQPAELESRLSELSRRISDARDRLEGAGAPARHSASELKQRHDFLRTKLDSASHDNKLWQMFNYEIALDITSLEQDLARWVDYLDKKG